MDNIIDISNKKFKNKYDITKIDESPDLLDNYYRKTLSNFQPDIPKFEYELTRRNTDSIGKLNSRYGGRRNNTEPFKDDLFLGFTDKDPRSIHINPMMGKYTEQMWRRKDDYKQSFKDDSDNSIPSEGISESKMLKNKKKTYEGFKTRYKNFEESTDAWTPGFKFMRSDKSGLEKQETDNEVDDLSKVELLNKRRDYENILSLNALPEGWNSTPDHKIKIAKYSQLLKSKNLNDIDINKNKNNQIKDNKQNNLDIEQKLLSQLIILQENLINKKLTENETNNNIKYQESKDNYKYKINKSKEYMKNNELSNTILDNKKGKLEELLVNNYKINNLIKVINEILTKSELSGNKNYLEKGNNKEVSNKKNLDKNKIISEILFKNEFTNNQNYLNKGNNKENVNLSSNLNLLKNEQSKFLYTNNVINNNIINKYRDGTQIYNYSNIIPKDFKMNINGINGFENNKLGNYNHESYNILTKPNMQLPKIKQVTDYITDAEFKDSGFKTRYSGLMGTKYQFKEKEFEQNEYDTINDFSTSLRK